MRVIAIFRQYQMTLIFFIISYYLVFIWAITTYHLFRGPRCGKLIRCIHRYRLGSRGSNPGWLWALFQTHVAMSSCTKWPPKRSTNMGIDYCTINIQTCMIPFCVRSTTLVKVVYHSFVYDKCTMRYDHICTPIFCLADCRVPRTQQWWKWSKCGWISLYY